MELCFPSPPPPFFLLIMASSLEARRVCSLGTLWISKRGGRAMGCWTTVPILLVSLSSPPWPRISPLLCTCVAITFVFMSRVKQPVAPSCDWRRRDCGGWTLLCSSSSLVERERERKKSVWMHVLTCFQALLHKPVFVDHYLRDWARGLDEWLERVVLHLVMGWKRTRVKHHDRRQPLLVTGKTFAHRILLRATSEGGVQHQVKD